MTTLGSWIDAEAISGLGKQLTSPAEGGVRSSHIPLPLTKLSADDFRLPQNYLPAPFPGPENEERDKVRDLLRTARRRAEETGLVSGTGDTPVPLDPPASSSSTPPLNRSLAYFTPPAGPLATRIRAFIDWLRRQVPSQEVFIVDQNGNPVSDKEIAADLVTAAVLVSEAGRRALKFVPVSAEGAVHLDLPEERKLCVIDTITTAGAFFLGLVLTEALSARASDRLRRALKRTIESEPASVVVQQRAERW
jgi:hypothetical protein